MVRILLGHNGSNRRETVICYLETWEGEKISVKKDHTCSVGVSGSLGAVVSQVQSALSKDPHTFDSFPA